MLDKRKLLAFVLVVLCAPVVVVPYRLQWVSLSELTNTVVGVLVSALLAGAVMLWISSDQADRKKERIWSAIKKWVELPIIRFRDQQDTLPLAEKPPELAYEIEDCLSQKYTSIYGNLQKFRQEYYEWKNTESSQKFMKYEEGRPVINLDDVRRWDEFKVRELMRAHSQLVEQIKSEILAKYHTRLKC